MQQNDISCNRCVGGEKCCDDCGTIYIRHGYTASGKLRYKCRSCNKTKVDYYINTTIVKLLKEGVGIRSTARLLKISATTVIKRILRIARDLKFPLIVQGRTYEVDEIRTYIERKKRLIRIVYALERSSRQVVSFAVGARTNKTLNVVLKTLALSKARRIYTDKLVNYRYLINKTIHKTDQYCTNHIERKNLTIRTHLKRLNRRTICFSKSVEMLRACLTIYFYS